ncbi:nucleotidyltransferase family protein [Actinoplanes siamensis]|uniref:nucleotidyltransferase family protein n=2 Tax=Actinoplanes siamensis TaxID=1223317 RepID=UPI003673337A
MDEQLVALKSALSRNDVLLEVMSRTASLELPGWYVTAGCLFQTVWNVVTHRSPTSGIKDYDIFYFDSSDLSWGAEDEVIKTAQRAFTGLAAEVEIRNEARVHLWYEQKFGVPCPAYESTEAAIDSFAATTCCLGVRLDE